MIRVLIAIYLALTLCVSLVVTLLYWMGVITELSNGLWGVWVFWLIPWVIMMFIKLVGALKPRYDWSNDVTRFDRNGRKN